MSRTKTCSFDASRVASAPFAPLASLAISKYFIMIDVNLYEIRRTDARPPSGAEQMEPKRQRRRNARSDARLMQLHILLPRVAFHRLRLIFITLVIQFVRVFL